MKPTPKPPLPNLAFSLLLLLSLSFTLYSLKSLYTTTSSHSHPFSLSSSSSTSLSQPQPEPEPALATEKTDLHHIVFGIGSAAQHWARRKHFIKLWWRPNSTRGFVFFDRPINISKHDDPAQYPELKIPGQPTRPAMRMARIVSELTRMEGMDEGVRWFVMGDDDTVFYPDNLVRVLRKYDHTRMYYIGSNSETHLQNVRFAFGMAYGGGGFAISYPLAKAIERMQDRCLERYPDLFGSDDRVQACVSDLGVPLTIEPGFHQLDIYGSLFGLLTAHPITPLISMHHLDLVDPIFPAMGRIQALQQLSLPAKVDPSGLVQQSICYDPQRSWTISVSWGYAVQIIRGSITAREMEQPARTFVDWYKKDNPFGFSFNTRPFSKSPCEKPYVYFLDNVTVNGAMNVSRSEYVVHPMHHPLCSWKVESPEKILRVEVYKKINPHKWDIEAPRRDCCRVKPTKEEDALIVDVGDCREGEIIEPQLL